jgi:hypothetical protein
VFSGEADLLHTTTGRDGAGAAENNDVYHKQFQDKIVLTNFSINVDPVNEAIK